MAKSIEAKFGSSGVTAASLHPGSGVPTSIARQWKVAMWFHQKLISWFVKDLDQVTLCHITRNIQLGLPGLLPYTLWGRTSCSCTASLIAVCSHPALRFVRTLPLYLHAPERLSTAPNCFASFTQGSSTTLFCCLAEHDELRGRYFNDCAAYPSSDLATPAACECLWEVSEALVARAMIDPRPADVYIGPSSALSLASGCGFGKSEVSGTVEVHSPEIRSQ